LENLDFIMLSILTLPEGGQKGYKLGCTLYNQKRYSEAERHLQQVADKQEKTLGDDHRNTLLSKHWLGCTLYRQGKYSEAESLFQQASDGREKTLGSDYKETLDSTSWLGRTLYMQRKLIKAETLLRKAVEGKSKTLGINNDSTHDSKHWLGCTLYVQQNYSEAERFFRQVSNGREKLLGSHHTETLSTKHCLGHTLYGQKKYSEAERLFRQASVGREKLLGSNHSATLSSKHWLGHTLYEQQRYSDAERLLRQVSDGREKLLGSNHNDTLFSKHWLGRTLYEQQKYSYAQRLFFEASDGREKLLGSNHSDTLSSKHWLGRTLYKQEKYSDAETMFCHVADGQEKTLGSNHEKTLRTVTMLKSSQLNLSPKTSANITIQNIVKSRLISFFNQRSDCTTSYTDSEIFEILSLLRSLNERGSKVPRTYIVLRNIGKLEFLDDMIDGGFSDYYLPVTDRSLPGCLPPSVKASFVKAQSQVLTKSMNLEKGGYGQHCYYDKDEPPPLERKGILGSGGFGQIDRVFSLISFKEYARKQIPRGLAFRGRQKEDMKSFVIEIEIVKRLKHDHIVEFVGSYTDPKYICLIMSPVAQMDLAAYLKRANESNFPELRTFFGCLATALEYLHEQKVRHKDIKPSNILVNHGVVLFTDFGLSRDFTETNNSTTTGMANIGTSKYCAPEVALQSPRNTKSDIWSLGVVFMEMIVVLKGRTAHYMEEFYREHGSWQSFDRLSPVTLVEFVAELKGLGESSDNKAIDWTQKMLSADQQSRPTASSLVESILNSSHGRGSTSFCGICCAFDDEEESSG
jgi:TolA-binding protein